MFRKKVKTYDEYVVEVVVAIRELMDEFDSYKGRIPDEYIGNTFVAFMAGYLAGARKGNVSRNNPLFKENE